MFALGSVPVPLAPGALPAASLPAARAAPEAPFVRLLSKYTAIAAAVRMTTTDGLFRLRLG
jgi:hypothetical protein